MSETLASMTLLVAQLLPGLGVVDSLATADGAAGKTTLVDGSFPIWQGGSPTKPGEDFFNGGTIWFIDCTNATLEGTTAVITDYATATGTYTFAAAAAQTKSGDSYAVSDRIFGLSKLREAVNEALRQIGGYDLEYEDAAFITVADQMAYALPTGYYNLKRVYIARNSSAPYDYVEWDHSLWWERNGELVFRDFEQPVESNFRIKFLYNLPLVKLTADSSALPNLYPAEWVQWKAAAHIIGLKNDELGGKDKGIQGALAKALAMAQMQDAIHMPQLDNQPPSPEYSIWS